MIFRQIEEILNGTKTQTRRVLFEGEYETEEIDGVIVAIYKRSSSRSCRWQLAYMVGKTYSIQPGRGKRAIEGKRIKVVALRVERVQNITEEDAIAEGVKPVIRPDGSLLVSACVGYKWLWESINKTKGTRWENNPLVAVITFEVVDAQ